MTIRDNHTASYGETSELNLVERFGVWLSKRRIQRTVGSLTGKDVADIGCGYQATIMRRYLDSARSALLVDLSLADDLKVHPKVTAVEGELPGALTELPARSLDVILCMSVIEHLWEPELALKEFRRLLRPGGVCAINVPSWAGKPVLEYVAFKLGWAATVEGIDDHKMYYNPRDLWPLLVQAGFRPSHIRVFKHKFRLNTFAVCRVGKESQNRELQ
jgi:2-polyprenyl-3-methyl-5-hydroxy-6-metoxy-1,4-benzoquinol methylase